MKNKKNTAKRSDTAIRTRHVYIENEQVFLKKETQEVFVADTNVAEWFPTDFRWIPTSF